MLDVVALALTISTGLAPMALAQPVQLTMAIRASAMPGVCFVICFFVGAVFLGAKRRWLFIGGTGGVL